VSKEKKNKKKQVKNIQRICIEVKKGSDTSKLNYPLDFLSEIFLSDFDTWGGLSRESISLKFMLLPYIMVLPA